jgi:RNA polymerase sigma-70 factor (ECF subfamily)
MTEPADDTDVFARLYRQHRLTVFRYLRGRGSSPDDAADLTAATFERALMGLARYRPGPDGHRPWLLRIARNLAIDAHRRHESADRGFRLLRSDTTASDPVDLVIRDETDRLLADRMAKLPAVQREAIVLRFAGGMSAREIGAVIDKSEAATQKLLSRALEALREAYREPAD